MIAFLDLTAAPSSWGRLLRAHNVVPTALQRECVLDEPYTWCNSH